jgi:type I restriction enzyme S subunit
LEEAFIFLFYHTAQAFVTPLYKKLKANVELLSKPDYAVMIRTTNFEKADFQDDLRYITKKAYEFLHKSKVKSGDILMNKIASAGSVYYMPNLHCPTSLGMNMFLLRTNEEITDQRFIYYYLKSNESYIKQFAVGTATTTITKDRVRNLVILQPPLSIQRKIAAILSAYDDLIEINTRRIAILEEMAQSLYREWFVHFRFPGHEKKRLVESELGLIPEGWEVVKASYAVEIDPLTKVPKEGEKPFVSMGSLSIDSMLIENVELRSGNSGSKFKNGDTLFARITPCLENGKTGFVQFLPSTSAVAFGSTEFIILRSKTLCPEYVYLMARSNEFRDNAIKSMTGATGRQRVQTACFEKFLIAQPHSKTLEAFKEMVSPIFPNISVLARKNSNLRKTRDLLLPKLISGEVDVEGIDIHIERESYESSREPIPSIS